MSEKNVKNVETVEIEVEVVGTIHQEYALVWTLDVPKEIVDAEDADDALTEFIREHEGLEAVVSNGTDITYEEISVDEVYNIGTVV